MECKSMKNRVVVFLVLVLFCTSFFLNLYSSQASSGYSFIILSRYNCNMKIGQSFFLAGIASNGKRITWKSSKSSIASVNTYGQVTAKKAVNLRSIPSTEDPRCVIVAQLDHGTIIRRTGINKDLGWSRVDYNGQPLYCITSYLKVVD